MKYLRNCYQTEVPTFSFLELCSVLGIKKINTSGLVEKFNSTLQSMIAKSTDPNRVEWENQLPLLLFAYRSVVQESTKET